MPLFLTKLILNTNGLTLTRKYTHLMHVKHFLWSARRLPFMAIIGRNVWRLDFIIRIHCCTWWNLILILLTCRWVPRLGDGVYYKTIRLFFHSLVVHQQFSPSAGRLSPTSFPSPGLNSRIVKLISHIFIWNRWSCPPYSVRLPCTEFSLQAQFYRHCG
jgi:hypothetical protein